MSTPHLPGARAEDPSMLRTYAGMVRRRMRAIVVVTAAVVALFVLLALRTERVYEGTATIVMQSRLSDTLFASGGSASDVHADARTQVRVVSSARVRQEVEKRLGHPVARANARVVPNTGVIEIGVRSLHPSIAAQTANEYAAQYIAYRRQQAVDDLFAAGQAFQKKIDDLRAQLAAVRPGPDGDLRRTGLTNQIDLFSQRLDQLQVDATLKSGGAELVTPAEVPADPIEPRPLRSAFQGLFLGLAAGVALGFILDQFDDRLRDEEDVRAASGLPTMGVVSHVPTWRDRSLPTLVTVESPHSGAAEDYQSLRTALQFMTLESSLQTVLVTSAIAGEGKTSTVTNLAVTLCRSGARVLIVDADVRNPRMHTFFGFENTKGLTDVLRGELTFAEAATEPRSIPRLTLLTAGRWVSNTLDLLTQQTGDLIVQARRDFDIILIDSPPVAPVADAVALSGMVDAVIFVASIDQTTRGVLSRTVGALRQVDAPLIGTVVNHSRPSPFHGYGYGRYGYGRYGYGRYGYGRTDRRYGPADAGPSEAKRSVWRRTTRSGSQ